MSRCSKHDLYGRRTNDRHERRSLRNLAPDPKSYKILVKPFRVFPYTLLYDMSHQEVASCTGLTGQARRTQEEMKKIWRRAEKEPPPPPSPPPAPTPSALLQAGHGKRAILLLQQPSALLQAAPQNFFSCRDSFPLATGIAILDVSFLRLSEAKARKSNLGPIKYTSDPIRRNSKAGQGLGDTSWRASRMEEARESWQAPLS